MARPRSGRELPDLRDHQLAGQEVQHQVRIDRNVPQPTGELVDHQPGRDAGGVERAAGRAAPRLGLLLSEQAGWEVGPASLVRHPMAESTFVYVTYIRTTPEKLWRALLDPEFTRQYWVGTWQDCTWQQAPVGS